MKKSFFAFCIAVVLIAIAPLTAGALEVIVTDKYTPKNTPRAGWMDVAVLTDVDDGGSFVKLVPGKAATVLRNSRVKRITGMNVAVGSAYLEFRFSIKGSKITFHLVNRKGRIALYSPQLKKYYYNTAD